MSGKCESASDSKVVTVSRLAQWRIENIYSTSCRRSDPFKIGIWNWYLVVKKKIYIFVGLYPESRHAFRDLQPMAKFVLRVSTFDRSRRTYISPVHEKLLYSLEDFEWPTKQAIIEGRFTVLVEFLDLKISPFVGGKSCSIWHSPEMLQAFNTTHIYFHGGESCSTWPSRERLQALSSKNTLRCLSHMLDDGIHTDVTIETSDGALKAHKAILASSSPIFKSMFLHDLMEKQSSTIKIEDISLESCSALLNCIYGAIKVEDFWKHRASLLHVANKYDMPNLKDLCEESLLEDINRGNILERLQEAWLYQLHKLKRACWTYLFAFDKIYDLREEMSNFFWQADRELLLDMFQGALTIWKPSASCLFEC